MASSFGNVHSVFCFGTVRLRGAVSPPGFPSSFRSYSLLQTTLRSMVKGDMVHRNMAIKSSRGRHTRSPHIPFFLRVYLSISTILSSTHSPSTQAPLQPLSQVTITMTVRDVVCNFQSIYNMTPKVSHWRLCIPRSILNVRLQALISLVL